jgi:hypothetical protein
VIGPEWATVTDARRRRRLDDPDDFVALEVGTALPRPEVKVIPVLVDGARMPMQKELPPALAALAVARQSNSVPRAGATTPRRC